MRVTRVTSLVHKDLRQLIRVTLPRQMTNASDRFLFYFLFFVKFEK